MFEVTTLGIQIFPHMPREMTHVDVKRSK
uniref:Uncharacterized protein n=1 Tax=Rhizophora mucronata TaxID=61149 RepID=A0A2P2QF14_RHIMU